MATYGWFSMKARDLGGSTIYKNAAGDEVEVTEVGESPEPSSSWDDLVSVGEVTCYVRRAAESSLESVSVDYTARTLRPEPILRRYVPDDDGN